MNFFESHFWYSKSQRNGILVLILLIVLFQLVSSGLDRLPAEKNRYSETFEVLEKRMDSLKRIQDKADKYKLYPFNPNYLTDFKGYRLGMSPGEIDRLMEFRKNNRFLSSAQEFQQITGVSDSLLNAISPLFKFPSWASTPNGDIAQSVNKVNNKITASLCDDLNKATIEDLITVSGVTYKMANRIISYRKRLKGYTLPDQLHEVYFLKKKTAEAILMKFKIQERPVIEKLNLNQASFKELLSLPYLDYNLTKRICDYRREVLLVTDLNELKKIDSFPLEKFERIALYLTAE